MAAAGPAAGAAASLLAVGVGLALSAGGAQGISFEPGAFDDSLLIGVLGARAARHSTACMPPCMRWPEHMSTLCDW